VTQAGARPSTTAVRPAQIAAPPRRAGKPRGLTVKIFRTPVTIHWTFALLLVVFTFSGRRPFPYGLTFGLVVLVSVLIHEAGHAIAFASYGRSSRIEINALAGLTITQAEPPLPDSHAIITSLAGPFAGVAVGLLAFWGERTGMGTNHEMTRVLLSDIIFVNLGWGLLNLIPMLPLDGGHVMQRISDRIAPERSNVVPYVFSIVVAVGLAVWVTTALDIPQITLTSVAVYLVLIVSMNLALLRQHRADDDLKQRQANVASALQRITDADPSVGIAQLESVLATERNAELYDPAANALTWALVWRGDHGDAERAMQYGALITGRVEISLALAAASARAGRPHEAMALLARGFAIENVEPPPWYIDRVLPSTAAVRSAAAWIDQMDLGERHQGLSRLASTLDTAGRRGDAAEVRSLMMKPVQRV